MINQILDAMREGKFQCLFVLQSRTGATVVIMAKASEEEIGAFAYSPMLDDGSSGSMHRAKTLDAALADAAAQVVTL